MQIEGHRECFQLDGRNEACERAVRRSFRYASDLTLRSRMPATTGPSALREVKQSSEAHDSAFCGNRPEFMIVICMYFQIYLAAGLVFAKVIPTYIW
jgi:hypothetical protein